MRLPLEDNYLDVIAKAQRGLKVSDVELAARAGLDTRELDALKRGRPAQAALRAIAPALKLNAAALEELAGRGWYPTAPTFPYGFFMSTTDYGDMTVNSYLAWDPRARVGAAFDTGADAGALIDTVRSERLRLTHLFLTHTHEDHVADLDRLVAATGAEIWASEREPVPSARTFGENAQFHLGSLAVRTLSTWGHSPGQTSYFVTGLSYPLAVVGDSLFAGSMGGSADHYAEQRRNDVEKLLSLPNDTVLACGHGPLTTVGQEKQHNPFFAQ